MYKDRGGKKLEKVHAQGDIRDQHGDDGDAAVDGIRDPLEDLAPPDPIQLILALRVHAREHLGFPPEELDHP
jgi:hypothetical protein